MTDATPTQPTADRPPLAMPILRSLGRWWAVGLFLVIGALVTVDPPYDNTPAIRSDGLGYHAWTRALLDGNVSFCPYVDISYTGALQPASELGRCANKYQPGLALLRFPVMAPFTATNGGQIRSLAEDRVNQWFSLAAGALAMSAAIAASVRLGATRSFANVGAAVVMFGSNQFHYATYDSSFTHIYSAAMVAALLLIVVRAVQERRALGLIEVLLVVALVGFLLDIRMMLVAPLATVGLGLLAYGSAVTSFSDCLRVHWKLIAAASTGAALALAQQLLYNHYIFGDWRLSAYVGEEFSLSQAKQLHVLFSTTRGALLWSPAIALGFVTIIATRQKAMLIAAAGSTITLALIYGAWHSWDLAGGFGHRGFVEVTPLLATGLAVGLSRLSPRPRLAVLIGGAISIVITVGLMRAYWARELGFFGATNSEYVRYAIGSRSLPAYLFERFTG